MQVNGLIQIHGNARDGYTLEAMLSGFLFEEGGKWVSYCKMLDLSSCGNTANEALENIREAIRLFFQSCVERNTLHQALMELGWMCQTPEGDFKQLSDRCFPSKIPPAFIIEQLKKDGESWTGKVILKDV